MDTQNSLFKKCMYCGESYTDVSYDKILCLDCRDKHDSDDKMSRSERVVSFQKIFHGLSKMNAKIGDKNEK
jgi:hypothetical protein